MNRWITLALLAGLIPCGCGKRGDASTVVVGTWKTQQTIQPFVYQRFLPDGMTCDVRAFTNPGEMKTALLAGSLDMCGTTLVHAIASASRGESVVVVASLCNKCSALVVRTDADIRTEGDLRGKRIGYVPSTMHHILLLGLLRRAGISAADVTLIRVDFFDMLSALQHGQIDAFLSGEPFPARAEATGAGRVLSYPYFDDSVGTINGAMIVRRETLERSPETVRELVRAHAAATNYLQADPDEWIRSAAAFGHDEEILRKAADNIALSWDMDERFVAQVRHLGEAMLELGMIERLPDWDALIYTRFVEELRNTP